MAAHKFKPETTNGGNCFADCSCGWSGGVHPTRQRAKDAWNAHVNGGPPVEPLRPELLFGPRARGMEA